MIAVAEKPSPPPAPQVLSEDDDTDFDWPVRRSGRAQDFEQRPKTVAPNSVFALAAAAKALKASGQFGSDDCFRVTKPTVTREDGVVRVVGGQYPANRWTADRDEQERQRRARQKPPRPTKKAKTRGKKVRKWDGEDVE